MSSYVIQHNDGGYLCMKDGKWDRTQNQNKAERMSYEKACNVYQNSISPSLRQFWTIEKEEELPKVDELSFDWEELAEAQSKLYVDLKNHAEYMNIQLSVVDREICDIEHYIEFFALDAAKGYKAYRMLKERLKRRRYIKDEMAKVNVFLRGASGDFSSGKVSRQIKDVDTTGYKPRVLNELFGLETTTQRLPHVC